MWVREIKLAVVTGGHNFDVLNFNLLFRDLKDMDTYIQHMDDFTASSEAMRDSYDAILFYNYITEIPNDATSPWWAGKRESALKHLGTKSQGIVVMHHAILSYPGWFLWNDLVGIKDRSFKYFFDQDVELEIASKHPSTEGLTNWHMKDETYLMADAKPADGNTVLLKTTHKNSFNTLAWVRKYKNSKVICLQSGHDSLAWRNPTFKKFLHQTILWSVG